MKNDRRLARESRPRPPSPPCLDAGSPSSQRGGTLLAEGVRTLDDHQSALLDADCCRPKSCPTCRHGRMHVHDYRERKPKGDTDWPPVIAVMRFNCAACDAVWLVLPSFLSRHLWRVWTTVGVVLGGAASHRVLVPRRTRQRWRARQRSVGRKLVSVLAVAGESLAQLAAHLGHEASRREVIDALGGLGRLAEHASLVHRLARGVRVM